MSRRPEILDTLRHRDFARVMAAMATSAIGTWAYNVALAVWLLEETGEPGWLAAATVCRFVPALMTSAYGGVLADRFERVTFMRVLDVVLCLVMVCLAVEAALGVHPAVLVATAAFSSAVGAAYEPAVAALIPQLVPERDLGAANALRGTVDNVCVIAGPGIGAVVTLVADPAAALVVNAASFLVSALVVSGVSARSTPVDVTEGGEAGVVQQAMVGIRTIATSPSTTTLVGFSLVATLVFGADTVLFPVVSEQVLGTGAEGYGFLLAGLGAGGILVSALVPRLERSSRLGIVILVGMVGYCLPLLVFLVTDNPVVGFLAQVLRGASTLAVDVLAITALQRSVPPDRLARVFGAFDSLMLLAVLVGSLLVPVGLSLVGLETVLWALGLGLPVACLLGLPRLLRLDAEAAERRAALAPKVALLERCDLFASVRRGAVEQLAGSADVEDVAAGAVVVEEGAPADAFYVVDAGRFVAASSLTGDALEEMGEGDWFGEIGLIEAIPRTATVAASTAGRLLRVDGAAFTAALTQDPPSPALLSGAELRLGRTHRGRRLTRAGLAPPPG